MTVIKTNSHRSNRKNALDETTPSSNKAFSLSNQRRRGALMNWQEAKGANAIKTKRIE